MTIFVQCVLVKTLQHHDTVEFVQDSETEDSQLVAWWRSLAWDRQWKRDLRLWLATSSLKKNWQGGWLLRQLKSESRTAAEVVMDDALVQDDGIDLIVEELDRCWEVTQDQDKASKIENTLFRDTEGRQNGNDLHVLRGTEEA